MNQRQSILVDNGKFIEESFLVNTLGNRMTGNYIAKRFKAILKRSGINRDGSLHCLRATVITQLVEAGMPIEKVQEFSGHVCVDTVHVYAMKRKMKDNLKMVA
jgi:site-specific recombinase XerD